MIIKDGAGSGASVKVSPVTNRIHASAISSQEELFHAQTGDAYRLNTGLITLTTANESGILYLKNNEENDLVITGVILRFGTTVSGSGNTFIKMYRNPTTGSLVSTGTDLAPTNRNFGSSNTLDVDSKIGTGAALTITNGDVVITTVKAAPPYDVSFFTNPVAVLPRGTSLAFSVTPPTGNISMACQTAISIFLDDGEF